MTDDSILMRRLGDSLVPANRKAWEMVKKLDERELIIVKPKQARSNDQNRLYWSLLEKVAEATHFETAEKLHIYIKLQLGLFDLMKLPNGQVVPVPHSTSFRAKDHETFNRYFDQAIDIICRDVIPHATKEDLIAEVMGMGRAA